MDGWMDGWMDGGRERDSPKIRVMVVPNREQLVPLAERESAR